MFDQEVSSVLGPGLMLVSFCSVDSSSDTSGCIPEPWAHVGPPYCLLSISFWLPPIPLSIIKRNLNCVLCPGLFLNNSPKEKKPGGCTWPVQAVSYIWIPAASARPAFSLCLLHTPFYASTLCFDSWETQGTEKGCLPLLSRHLQSHEQVWNSFMNRTGLEPGALQWSGRVPCLFVPSLTTARWMMFLRCFLVVTHSGVLLSWQRCGSDC